LNDFSATEKSERYTMIMQVSVKKAERKFIESVIGVAAVGEVLIWVRYFNAPGTA
jgi:hypothetical protein